MIRWNPRMGLVALAVGLCSAQVVEAANPSPAQLAASRRQFVRLLRQQQQTGQPAVIPLDRIGLTAVRNAIIRQGPTPPRIPPNLTLRNPIAQAQVRFRQAYLLAMNQQGYFLPGGFQPRPVATPIAAVRPFNPFRYFPVLRPFQVAALRRGR